jgi:2-iminobutanoate/2-iminopropanoate deaminase
MSEKKSNRRNLLRGAAAMMAGGAAAQAAEPKMEKKVHYKGAKPAKPGLFSGAVSYGNLLFIAGKGAHYKGTIEEHTKTVLDEIEAELKNAGSSMDKCLKCNVYLAKAEDYAAMNKVFAGRFGAEPPVRTTVAPAWVPGDSLVEIDVIAYI